MDRWTRLACFLALPLAVTSCGHSPTGAAAAALSIVSLTAQVQNATDGGYTYVLDYAVRNDGSSPVSIVSVDTAVAVKGTPLRSFSVTYLDGGLAVAPAQTLTPATSSFGAPVGAPRADSLTITVHYNAGGGERTVARATPLG